MIVWAPDEHAGSIGAALARRLRALDVTDPEPPPDGHPLWTAPGVVISSHVAGDSPESFVRAYEPVAAQVPRFREGRPLLNVVRA